MVVLRRVPTEEKKHLPYLNLTPPYPHTHQPPCAVAIRLAACLQATLRLDQRQAPSLCHVALRHLAMNSGVAPATAAAHRVTRQTGGPVPQVAYKKDSQEM